MCTVEKIAENSQKAQEDAREAVVAGLFYNSVIELEGYDDEIVKAVWEYEKDGLPTAYAVKIEVDGYGGIITAMVGVNADGTVRNVVISGMSETAGLGTRISEDKFRSQYEGKAAGITVAKSGEPKDNEIAAVSGATISSRAITKGVNAAIDAAVGAYNDALAKHEEIKEVIDEEIASQEPVQAPANETGEDY
jgi:electron transport complex protein RnfG